MADVVRWVDLQEETEVRLLLEAAGIAEALAAAEAWWEDRANSSVSDEEGGGPVRRASGSGIMGVMC